MAKKPTRLSVTSIEIQEVLGAKRYCLEPGRITKLTGRNGSGKTTVLTALQAALQGGNLAKLARVDPEGGEVEPEVVLVLEGPGSESYRVEKSGNKTAVVKARVGDSAAFKEVPQPQAFLRALYDARGANPVSFLTAKDEERALLLLEALPLTLDRAELDGILGDLAQHVPALPPSLHPLQELELVHDAIFRARTGVNHDQRGKANAAEQTRRGAPAKVPDDPKAEISALEKETTEAAAAVARQEVTAAAAQAEAAQQAESLLVLVEEREKGHFQTEAQKLRRAHEQKAAELRATVERQIAELKDQTDAAVQKLQEAGELVMAAAESDRDTALEGARQAREAARFKTEAAKRDVAAKRETLAALRAQSEESARARTLHEQAKQFDQDSEELKAQADHMTATLEAIAAYRRRLADKLPVPGLEISGKAIRVHGVPYEQLNTQSRIDIAVQVSCLRAKDSRLPLVLVDGAEALDAEHFEALVARLSEEGVQAMIGRVEDHDLTAETIGEAVTA